VKFENSVVNLLLFSAYKDEDGKPWVLPFVLRIENEMIRSATYNHEYIPFLGMDQFTKLVPPTVLGENSPALKSGRVSIDYLIIYYIYRVSQEERT
jgi:aspartate/tyrosine/aromatic aminotransferase